MTVTTEDGGRTNIFAKEPQLQVMDISVTHNEKAEMLNGRLAMLAVTTYVLEEFICGQPITQITPQLFTPIYAYPSVQAFLDGNFAQAAFQAADSLDVDKLSAAVGM